MTIEVATYINDLQPVNPPSTDPVSQGDDHLRLIKQVLQNQFPGASRTTPVGSAVGKTTSYTVVKNDGNGVLYAATSGGAITFTLPGLAAADAGWSISFIKTSIDVNPMFIKPASGTITSGTFAGLTQARRCIPGVRSTAIWDGANWFITRSGAAPIGCMLDFYGTTLPTGYEWPNGQTLASASTNYPEYFAAQGSGLTPDLRGYAGVTLDNLGGAAAGHLPTTYIASGTLGATGGVDHSSLVTANLPPYTPAGSVATSTSISHNAQLNFAGLLVAGGTAGLPTPAAATISASSTSTFTGTAQGGTSSPFGLLQPSIMLGKILVVE